MGGIVKWEVDETLSSIDLCQGLEEIKIVDDQLTIYGWFDCGPPWLVTVRLDDDRREALIKLLNGGSV